MNNYFRITGYCEQEDFCFILDCNGCYEKLWQFSSMLVQVVVQSWRSPVYCLSASDFPCATAPAFFRTMPRSTSPPHQHIRI